MTERIKEINSFIKIFNRVYLLLRMKYVSERVSKTLFSLVCNLGGAHPLIEEPRQAGRAVATDIHT